MKNSHIRDFSKRNPGFNRFKLVSRPFLRCESRQLPSVSGRMRGPRLPALGGICPRRFKRSASVPNFPFLALALTSSLLQCNVLIDNDNRALLADFGFARVCNPPGFVGVSHSHDHVGGTKYYMAPELIAWGGQSTTFTYEAN